MKRNFLMIIFWICLIRAFAQTNIIVIPTADYTGTMATNSTVRITLLSPNPRVINNLPIRQEPMTLNSGINTFCYLTNLAWGKYRLETLGQNTTAFTFYVGTNTLGITQIGSLITNSAALPPNDATNYYTKAQVDALFASVNPTNVFTYPSVVNGTNTFVVYSGGYQYQVNVPTNSFDALGAAMTQGINSTNFTLMVSNLLWVSQNGLYQSSTNLAFAWNLATAQAATNFTLSVSNSLATKNLAFSNSLASQIILSSNSLDSKIGQIGLNATNFSLTVSNSLLNTIKTTTNGASVAFTTNLIEISSNSLAQQIKQSSLNGTNFTLSVSNSLYATINASTNGASVSFTTNLVGIMSNSLSAQITQQGLNSTNFSLSVSNSLLSKINAATNGYTSLVYTNPATILYTNALPALTNGFVKSEITNGLATTNYVNAQIQAATNGLGNGSTNGFTTLVFTNPTTVLYTNILPGLTNGLASVTYVNEQIQTLTNGANTNALSPAQAAKLAASASTNDLNALSNSIPGLIMEATNPIPDWISTAINSATVTNIAAYQAQIATNIIPDWIDSASNSLLSSIYSTNSANLILTTNLINSASNVSFSYITQTKIANPLYLHISEADGMATNFNGTYWISSTTNYFYTNENNAYPGVIWSENTNGAIAYFISTNSEAPSESIAFAANAPLGIFFGANAGYSTALIGSTSNVLSSASDFILKNSGVGNDLTITNSFTLLNSQLLGYTPTNVCISGYTNDCINGCYSYDPTHGWLTNDCGNIFIPIDPINTNVSVITSNGIIPIPPFQYNSSSVFAIVTNDTLHNVGGNAYNLNGTYVPFATYNYSSDVLEGTNTGYGEHVAYNAGIWTFSANSLPAVTYAIAPRYPPNQSSYFIANGALITFYNYAPPIGYLPVTTNILSSTNMDWGIWSTNGDGSLTLEAWNTNGAYAWLNGTDTNVSLTACGGGLINGWGQQVYIPGSSSPPIYPQNPLGNYCFVVVDGVTNGCGTCNSHPRKVVGGGPLNY